MRVPSAFRSFIYEIIVIYSRSFDRGAAVLRRMNLQVRAGLLFSKFTFCLDQLTVARSACSRLQHRMASRENVEKR